MRLPHFLLAGSLLLIGSSFAQAPATQWDRTLGGNDEERLFGMQATRDGGSILVGASESPLSGDKSEPSKGGITDYWVVKLDAQGQKQWDRTFGGDGFDEAMSVQQTTDGGYLVGGSSSSNVSADKTQPSQGGEDYWLLKLDAQGHKQWDRTLGGRDNDLLASAQQTADGGYLLGGTSYSEASGDKTQPSRGSADYWVVKLDAQGATQWDRTLGGSGADVASGAQQLATGGYLLGGTSYSGVSGDKTQPSQGGGDYWLIQLDAQGQPQWDRRLGGSAREELRAFRPTADGGALLAGTSASGATGDKSEPSLGGCDGWLVKLDAQGYKQWDRTHGSPAQEDVMALAPTPDGGYLMSGNLMSSDNSGRYWALKVTALGAPQWERTLSPGRGNTYLMQGCSTADGGYLLAGIATADAAGDKSEPSQGGLFFGDYWVVKLAPTVLAQRPASAPTALQVFPNPTHGDFIVKLPDATPRAGLHLDLVNALGRVVFQHALPLAAQFTVPAGVAPVGMYWVRLRGPQGYQATQRIVLL